MVLTTLLLAHTMLKNWRWSLATTILVAGVFLVVDVGFFVANLTKIAEGGWVPLTLGVIIFAVMISWRSGIQALRSKLAGAAETAGEFLADVKAGRIVRVPGVAVFLTRPTDKVPAFLSDYAKNMGSLHKTIIALQIGFKSQPRMEQKERSSVEEIAGGFWRVTLNYGFVQIPDLREDLKKVGLPGSINLDQAVFFGARDLISAGRHSGVAKGRLAIFSFLYRNAVRTSDRFNLPPEKTMELTRQIRLYPATVSRYPARLGPD